MVDEATAPINQPAPTWLLPMKWVVGVLFFLGLYLFAYPIFVLSVEKNFGDAPDWFVNLIDLSVEPLVFLDENLVLYRLYIEWLVKIIET